MCCGSSPRNGKKTKKRTCLGFSRELWLAKKLKSRKVVGVGVGRTARPGGWSWTGHSLSSPIGGRGAGWHGDLGSFQKTSSLQTPPPVLGEVPSTGLR